MPDFSVRFCCSDASGRNVVLRARLEVENLRSNGLSLALDRMLPSLKLLAVHHGRFFIICSYTSVVKEIRGSYCADLIEQR